MAANADNIVELSIYTSDMSSIPAIAKNMAVSFPQIGYFHFCNREFLIGHL